MSVIHDPQVVILDEPFTGLDMVDTELLKTIVRDLKEPLTYGKRLGPGTVLHGAFPREARAT